VVFQNYSSLQKLDVFILRYKGGEVHVLSWVHEKELFLISGPEVVEKIPGPKREEVT